MVTPGSSTGSVHRQQQGTGKATILQGDRALDTFDLLSAEDRTIARQEKAAEKAKMDSAYDAMIKFDPEHWYKHDNQVRTALNAWHNKGAELMASGINPWKGTDEKSLEWRKEQIKVASLAQASKQMQERFTATRQKLDGADPNEYTSASLKNNYDWFNTDLEKVVSEGLLQPELSKRKPFIGLQDFFSKTMQPLNQKRNGKPYSQDELWDIAKTTVADPETADDLAITFKSALAQMDEKEQADVKRRAQAAGVSIPQQMAYDYASRYAIEQKPFSYDDWKKVALGRVEVPYREWKGSENFSKRVDKAELEKITNSVARDMFVADDRALLEYESVLPRKQNETDGDYKKRAIADLAQDLRNQTATQELAGQTDAGKDKANQTASEKLWLENMMSVDTEKNKEAVGYLMHTPGLFPGLTVENGAIYEDQPGKRELKLYLAGNLEYAKVKTVMEQNGLPIEQEQIEPRSTNTIVTVPITDQTENWLLRLHDKAFKDTKQPYQGPRTIIKPDLRMLANPKSTQITPPGNTPTKNRF